MKYRVVGLCIWLSVFSLQLQAQLLPPYEYLKAKYPNEYAVITNMSEHLHFLVKGDSLVTYSDHAEEIVYLKQPPYAPGNSVYYSAFSHIADLQATYLLPVNGKKYKLYKSNYFESEKVNQSGIFFDDSKRYRISYPSSVEGMVTRLSYREHLLQSRLISPFYFNYGSPAEKAEYKVSFPAGKVNIRYEMAGVAPEQLQFRDETVKGIRTLTWRLENVPTFVSDVSGPNVRYFMPHVIVWVEGYQKGQEEQKVLPDAAGLYNWLIGLTLKSMTGASPKMGVLVDSLVAGATTEAEKVRRIFYWVQDNISYIAFEDGYAGYIPREPEAIFRKRYGDCKDMANILRAMAAHVGIDLYLTWIGTRDLPYNCSQVSIPGAFNHMIASYIDSTGQVIYLDATSSKQPFGLPTGMIQGKEALIGIDSARFRIEKVPVIAAEKNYYRDSLSLSLTENNQLAGSGKIIVNGYPKVNMSYVYAGQNSEKQLSRFNSVMEIGNNKSKVTRVNFENITNRDVPIHVDFDFQVNDYIKVLGDEMYINLNLEKARRMEKLKENREIPVESDYEMLEERVVVFQIPAGYHPRYVPANKTAGNEKFGFGVQYEVKDGQIIRREKFYTRFLLLEKDQFKEWNKVLQEYNIALNEAVSFIKK